jgi:outer membrane protein TolC
MKLQSAAAIACLLLSQALSNGLPYAEAQQQTPSVSSPSPTLANPTAGLPAEPAPVQTNLGVERPGTRNYAKPNAPLPEIWKPYTSVGIAAPRVTNSPALGDLVKDGKIYLSLSDAILLALENNYDIAIARYNLDIADTDILLAKSGAGTLLGVNSGLIQNTTGGQSSTLSSGGGPGGTSAGASGAASGTTGLTTAGLGTIPQQLDPVITSTVQLERTYTPEADAFLSGGQSKANSNTDVYNFGYQQGFLTGTSLDITFNNTRYTSNSLYNTYSPTLQSEFKTQITQSLLQGFGTGVNGRFIARAKNDRRITDSSFRLQLLYTINQVENIYWALVSSYEDVLSKQRAVDQSTQVASDDRKELQIGTLAPLDVLNADNAVATDKQALISSQTNLQYQQLVMKQAIARNLNDPALLAAPVIPTDRVSLAVTPEEQMPTDQLVQEAYANRPEIEQSILNLKNAQLTIKGVKNALLPTVNLYAYYSGNAVGGAISPLCQPIEGLVTCKGSAIGYGTVLSNLFNSTGPDKAVGVNVNIPLRNRDAQAVEARSLIEYRQDQMKLEQQYVEVRIQVINKQYALTNDRAAVQAAFATRDYNRQALTAEEKKFHLGASTSANVLQQQRNVAAAENTVISDLATYAIDRASLEYSLANTLEKYGINVGDAVGGKMNSAPIIPGLEPAPKTPEAGVQDQQQQLEKTRETPAPSGAVPPATPPQ